MFEQACCVKNILFEELIAFVQSRRYLATDAMSIIDSVSCSLFKVRGSKPGKTVLLTEAEIRGLCIKTREIFLSQPILLELEAPLKICGKFLLIFQQILLASVRDDTLESISWVIQ